VIVRQGLVIGIPLLLASIIQVTLLSRLGLPGATPDLLVVTVVAVALAMGPVQGAFAGFLAGAIIDVSPPSDTVVGVNSIVYLAIGFVAGYIVDNRDRTVFGMSSSSGSPARPPRWVPRSWIPSWAARACCGTACR